MALGESSGSGRGSSRVVRSVRRPSRCSRTSWIKRSLPRGVGSCLGYRSACRRPEDPHRLEVAGCQTLPNCSRQMTWNDSIRRTGCSRWSWAWRRFFEYSADVGREPPPFEDRKRAPRASAVTARGLDLTHSSTADVRTREAATARWKGDGRNLASEQTPHSRRRRGRAAAAQTRGTPRCRNRRSRAVWLRRSTGGGKQRSQMSRFHQAGHSAPGRSDRPSVYRQARQRRLR